MEENETILVTDQSPSFCSCHRRHTVAQQQQQGSSCRYSFGFLCTMGGFLLLVTFLVQKQQQPSIANHEMLGSAPMLPTHPVVSTTDDDLLASRISSLESSMASIVIQVETEKSFQQTTAKTNHQEESTTLVMPQHACTTPRVKDHHQDDNDDDDESEPPPLELLHIPKTGGTELELLAARHNITWGACHWVDQLDGQPCPFHYAPASLIHANYHVSYWHLPMHLLDDDESQINNPYRNAAVFAVVRNPYTRLVSQWNYKDLDVHDMGYSRNNPEHMNMYLQAMLRIMLQANSPAQSEYFLSDGHFIPQYDYIHNQKIAIIRHENIAEDFACLMQRYQLTQLQLPPEHVNAADGLLTELDLTADTMELIERVYEKDFVTLGYPKRQR